MVIGLREKLLRWPSNHGSGKKGFYTATKRFNEDLDWKCERMVLTTLKPCNMVTA
jgi:hypothetical protein